MGGMARLGLDLGTGFVKGVCDHGRFMFPSVYAKRDGEDWATRSVEKVGDGAAMIAGSSGVTAIRPIFRGRPDSKYQKQVEMLVREAARQALALGRGEGNQGERFRVVAGLPYHGFGDRDAVVRTVGRALPVESCTVIAQAAGTMVDLGKGTGIIASVGQGTTEIVAVEDFEVVGGESSPWASDFVTKKIGKFAHLDQALLRERAEACRRHSKILADNLAREIAEISANHGGRHEIVLSGGGIRLPGLRDALVPKLKGSKVTVHPDPSMSNALGMYKMAKAG